jgi:nitrite reductase/ring-hydroxylating ferredoxin subunit
MLLNLTAVAVYALNLWLRRSALEAAQTSALPLLLSFIGVGLLSVSGYLGGAMIYDDGIGVGRHRRCTPSPGTTIRATVAGSATEHGGLIFVPVAETDAIDENETLRVEIDGTVITVAKMDGQFFAFQEFCTHRFGPLSEGILHDGQIECPWHRSCFDVRTGKPTSGPAKVDLKTFAVRIEENRICIGLRPSARAHI